MSAKTNRSEGSAFDCRLEPSHWHLCTPPRTPRELPHKCPPPPPSRVAHPSFCARVGFSNANSMDFCLFPNRFTLLSPRIRGILAEVAVSRPLAAISIEIPPFRKEHERMGRSVSEPTPLSNQPYPAQNAGRMEQPQCRQVGSEGWASPLLGGGGGGSTPVVKNVHITDSVPGTHVWQTLGSRTNATFWQCT